MDLIKRTVLILLLPCIALHAQEDEPPPSADDNVTTEKPSTSTQNLSLQKKNLFVESINENEKAWLSVNGEQILAVYLQDITGKAHGGVLMLPEAGQYPTSRGIVNSLRHTLSEHHWHTLALDLTSCINDDGSFDEIKIPQLIQAGVDYLNQKGVYNIAILGEGLNAIQALYYAANSSQKSSTSTQFKQLRAVIMINAQITTPKSSNDILMVFKKIKLPVLDAYYGDNLTSQKQAKDRKLVAKRQMTQYYRQLRMPQMVLYHQRHDNHITKQIRGWLDNNVAGFMMKEK